jgi:hydroxymethylbilane synthase
MVQTSPVLRLGTRGSPLALAQAHETRHRLAKAHGIDPDRIAIHVIKTTGDQIRDRALSEAGGKGLFTKELDAALLDKTIDFAVHSAKDVPTWLEPGLALVGCLEREDVRDVLITRDAITLAQLPPGAKVGTASLRRQAQMLRARPDLAISLLRGNVETRLNRVRDGDFDATLLAMAGLKRLGLTQHAGMILPEDQFLPAVGQGAIALATRAQDHETAALLTPILDHETSQCVAAERAFLARLDGSCRTPIAGHARVDGTTLSFSGEWLSPDGRQTFQASVQGPLQNAAQLGDKAGCDIANRLPGRGDA